jgi:hypothetical protein
MSDRPIIFSAEMIKALLAGRKTQTRRLAYSDNMRTGAWRPSPWQRAQPGDRLWVREAWNLFALSRDCEQSWPVKSIPRVDPRDDEDARGHLVLDYATAGLSGTDAGKGPWRPSIHMPRWASRLTLTVTDVRVQRLKEITEADAQSEGVAPFALVGPPVADPHRFNFGLLWSELHGPNAWNDNPEVVALTFQVERRNIDATTKGSGS